MVDFGSLSSTIPRIQSYIQYKYMNEHCTEEE